MFVYVLLVSLENIPWVDIFWGFFFIGLFLTMKSLIGALSSDIDHDVDHDIDHDIDHDFEHDFDHDVDHDLDVDHDFDHDFDHDMDHDIDHDVDHDVDHEIDHDTEHGVDHDVEVSGEFFMKPTDSVLVISRGAPLMMLVGSFFLLYGGLGIILFSEPGKVFEKLFGMTLVVLLILWLINVVWSKLFKIETYVLPRRETLIGLTAEVVFTVDKDGGVIKVDVGMPKTLRFSAYPKDPDKVFPSGTKVRIVGWRKTFAIVEEA